MQNEIIYFIHILTLLFQFLLFLTSFFFFLCYTFESSEFNVTNKRDIKSIETLKTLLEMSNSVSLPPSNLRLKYCCDMDKDVLSSNFERRSWTNVNQDEDWNFYWASVFTVKSLFNMLESHYRLNDYQLASVFCLFEGITCFDTKLFPVFFNYFMK